MNRSDPSAVVIRDIPFDDVAAIVTTDIYEYLSYSTTALKNDGASRALKLAALKAFYHYYCVDVKRIAENPVEAVPAPKLEKRIPKYLSVDESINLLNSVSGDMPARDYCILTFFLNCGIRLSELTAMNVDSVRDDVLKVFGKGRKERIIYLNEACLVAFQNCLAERSLLNKICDEKALWISKRTGRRLSGRRIEQIVESTLASAGLSDRGYSPHKLRHTAATLAYQTGNVSILELKQILGHANISTTEIYTHLAESQMREVLASSPLSHITREEKGSENE